MPRQQFPRGIIAAVLLAAVLAAVNLLFGGHAGGGEPLKGAAELAGLPDAQLEAAVIVELGRQTFRDGSSPDAWRKLKPPALHLWAVAQAQRDISELGLAAWLTIHASEATAPGPADFRDGLAGMQLSGAAQVAEEILTAVATDQPAILRLLARLARELTDSRTARVEWVRTNLEAILGR